MKEYSIEEMRKNPISGYFWYRYDFSPEYIRIVEIHNSIAGWICENQGMLKNLPPYYIFYGPIIKPKIPISRFELNR